MLGFYQDARSPPKCKVPTERKAGSLSRWWCQPKYVLVAHQNARCPPKDTVAAHEGAGWPTKCHMPTKRNAVCPHRCQVATNMPRVHQIKAGCLSRCQVHTKEMPRGHQDGRWPPNEMPHAQKCDTWQAK